MHDQRLMTNSRQVTLQLATGEPVEGEIFLQLVGAYGGGGQSIRELINQEDCFLPVRRDGRVTLINLRQVASLAVAEADEDDGLMKLGECHRVAVQTTVGEEFSAEVFVNLPSGRTRVKDFLNQKLRFLPFFADGKVIYLNFRYILQVVD